MKILILLSFYSIFANCLGHYESTIHKEDKDRLLLPFEGVRVHYKKGKRKNQNILRNCLETAALAVTRDTIKAPFQALFLPWGISLKKDVLSYKKVRNILRESDGTKGTEIEKIAQQNGLTKEDITERVKILNNKNEFCPNKKPLKFKEALRKILAFNPAQQKGHFYFLNKNAPKEPMITLVNRLVENKEALLSNEETLCNVCLRDYSQFHEEGFSLNVSSCGHGNCDTCAPGLKDCPTCRKEFKIIGKISPFKFCEEEVSFNLDRPLPIEAFAHK